MYEYNFIEWIGIFYFYCVIGWCIESSYVSIKSKTLINRGFMRGPFLPLYGTGAIMMLLLSKPFHENIFLVFVAGCIGATILEYVTGMLMEHLFKIRYWDYSDVKFQYKGHICLGTTLSWGFLTIVMTRYIHQPIEQMLLAIPLSTMQIIIFIVTVIMVVDFTLSFKTALDMKDILLKMDKAKEELERVQKHIDIVIANMNDKKDVIMGDIKEELDELKKKAMIYKATRHQLKGFIDSYKKAIIKGNPTMISKRFKEGLEELKELVKDKKNKD